MKKIITYQSALGTSFKTVKEAMAHEDTLPELIRKTKEWLAAAVKARTWYKRALAAERDPVKRATIQSTLARGSGFIGINPGAPHCQKACVITSQCNLLKEYRKMWNDVLQERRKPL